MKWRVHRRVLDFVRLNALLSFRLLNGSFSAKLPSFPSQLSYIMDISVFRGMSKEQRSELRLKMAIERRKALEKYLRELLFVISMEVNITEVYEFLECSTLSFSQPETGWKAKEGYLRNRIFEARPRSCCWCIPKPKRFKTQWFIIRSSYILYVEQIDQKAPSDVILCDQFFRIDILHETSNNPLKPFTVFIINGSKRLEVRCESNVQMRYWIKDLQKLCETSQWCRTHKFNSFCPVRSGGKLNWLIDCKAYFEELAKVIDEAKEEIFIHGWWVTPELHLLRPASKFPEYRLDRLLQRKAMEGVKIYIIIFKEVTLALPINSYHTKVSLEKLHPNIKVQRHPDHLGGILLWAHHEKLVVVDQKIAFLGGIDLCFGRYDSTEHHLKDYHPYDANLTVWSGLDYSNPRIKDFRNVAQSRESLVDRKSVPRMPWHDINAVIYGASARDAARHFIQRWNFIKQQKSMHREEEIPFLLPKADFTNEQLQELNFNGTLKIQLLRSSAEWSTGLAPEVSIYDAMLHHIENSQHFIYIENQFFVSKCGDGQTTPVRNRVAASICSRIVRAFQEGKKFKVFILLPLLPAFEAAVNRSEASCLRVIMQGQYAAISRGVHSIIGTLNQLGIKHEDYISFLSLRKHDKLDGRYVTEQLYIHSKLMIIDDEVAILGSANINDRSMLGVRDTELAVLVEDEARIEATLNSSKVLISPKIRELRISLLKEHLGLLDQPDTDANVRLLDDPVSDDCYYNLIRYTASLNTQIYRELFRCVPDDVADSWDEYKRFTEKPKVDFLASDLGGIDLMQNLSAIRGNLVLFPLNFLRKEDLSASMLTPEYLLPIETYL